MIIDDHPLIIDGIIGYVESDMPKVSFCFKKALDCKEAYETILMMREKDIVPDVAIIDMNLPEYSEQNLFSGLEIGLLVRSYFPTTKIIMATGFTEIIPTKLMINKLQPDAVLCKTDITQNVFGKIFKMLSTGQPFFSTTIQHVLKNDLVEQLGLDKNDFEILKYLNKGIKTKDLPNYINLSLSTIEKRKAYMKFHLVGAKVTDNVFLAKAKMLNFIK